jgi:hypothetical protein
MLREVNVKMQGILRASTTAPDLIPNKRGTYHTLQAVGESRVNMAHNTSNTRPVTTRELKQRLAQDKGLT